MADIFISYKRTDRETAHKLAEELEKRGVSVWYDAKVFPGQDWRQEISKAIGDSKLTVALWPKDGAPSNMVYDEAATALNSGKLLSVRMGDGPLPLPFAAEKDVHSDNVQMIAAAIVEHLRRNGNAVPLEFGNVVPLPPQQGAEKRENKGFAFLSYCLEDSAFRDRVIQFLTEHEYLF